ncbi:MAG: hypothetical protein RMH75_06725 [Archaeoglobaceae archaeon]|nr:hypothetical protein [Archaeoglobaceae archaeon]
MIEALDSFFPDFPREIAWKYSSKNKNSCFVRNRYVKNVDELYQKLMDIKYDFFASVYSFEGEYQMGKAWERKNAILNRVFFDFDCKDSPAQALKDVKKLLSSLNYKPLVVYSGSKGFHVHIVFRRVRVRPEAIKKFGLLAIEKLKLKTCDPLVFDVSRLCRVPFSMHSSTNLKCTPIDADRIRKMTMEDVIRFVKEKWDNPDYELNEDVASSIERIEIFLREDEEIKRWKEEIPDLYRKGAKSGRLKMYIETLREHGCLAVNPQIREIHTKNKWISRNINLGAIEHIARVYLVLLLIEHGYSDEEIHRIMRFAKDYDAKKTQYYIDYNRKWLKKREALEAK